MGSEMCIRDSRKMVARLLVAEGWAVDEAGDGKAAISKVAAGTATLDCVVSDVNMPELDGFGLVAAIRAHDDDLPVLLMTGDPSLDGAVKAIDSGAVSYISKPFDHDGLTAAVARAARRHGVARMRRRADSYQRTVTGASDDQGELAARFDRALDRAWMAFQPIVDVVHHRIFAYEALLRTDEDSLRRTDHFIAAAERLDRVHELGRHVRTLVAAEIHSAPADVKLFVNVHGLELADELLFSPTCPLVPHAERVVLEITERTGLDPAAGPARVEMLRKQGYQIAVDDLGAGYAALGALASLEPEIVKLDMGLVRDLERHPTKRRVVAAIATLCRELGSKVVAEGVETEAEARAVVESGVELVQGYLFARPERGFGGIS